VRAYDMNVQEKVSISIRPVSLVSNRLDSRIFPMHMWVSGMPAALGLGANYTVAVTFSAWSTTLTVVSYDQNLPPQESVELPNHVWTWDSICTTDQRTVASCKHASPSVHHARSTQCQHA